MEVGLTTELIVVLISLDPSLKTKSGDEEHLTHLRAKIRDLP